MRKFEIIISVTTLVMVIYTAYLTSIQTKPVKDSLTKEARLALAYCLENLNGDRELSDGSTTTCRTILKDNGYILKSELLLPDIWEQFGITLFSDTRVIDDR